MYLFRVDVLAYCPPARVPNSERRLDCSASNCISYLLPFGNKRQNMSKLISLLDQKLSQPMQQLGTMLRQIQSSQTHISIESGVRDRPPLKLQLK